MVLCAAERLDPLAVTLSRFRRCDGPPACCPRRRSPPRWGGPATSRPPRVALHDAEDAVGKPGPLHDLGQDERDGRVLSDGFSTKQFPHAMALAIIHNGTMIGKLNGVMPATTPRGSSTVRMSMPVEISELDEPFSRLGMPQANSTFSMPRATSPFAVLEDLAVLTGDGGNKLVAARIEQLAQAEEQAGPTGERRTPPFVGRPDRGRDRLIHLSCRGQSDLAGLDALRRVVDRGHPTGFAGRQPARDPVPDTPRARAGASRSQGGSGSCL